MAGKIHSFFSAYPLKRTQKGEVMVQAVADPAGIFYLQKGQVQEYDIADNGGQVVINIFKPPAYFPMSWAINRTANQYFFEAATDIEYRLAPAEDVVQFLHDNHDVTFDLLARVYSGTDGLLRRMAHLMGGSARTRLLFELVVQLRRFGALQPDGSYRLKLNEQELAQRVGLSRETVSRELRALNGLATIDRTGLQVPNLTMLEKELDGHI